MPHPTSPHARRAALLAHLVVALVVLSVVAAALARGGPAGAAPPPPTPVRYQPPVDAPVADPFRAPDSPYGSGNRGIEYATAAGTPVRAVADGVVTFAGAVAGSRYVTVRHADGNLTSVGPLEEVLVAQGRRVARGQPVGIAGTRLHVGVRRDGDYIDPASLWARRAAVLEPVDGGEEGGRDADRNPTRRGGRWSGWWAGGPWRLRSSVGPPPGEPRPTSTRIHPNGRLHRR